MKRSSLKRKKFRIKAAIILRHVDLLLGNDRDISMFARQHLETVTEKRCFLCGACRDVISRTISRAELAGE
jgi:hypothetical protein